MRPGNRGKIESGWLARSLLNRWREPRRDEAGFTGSSDGVRALSGTRKEPARREAIRSRFQSSEVAQGRFRPLSEWQLPKGQMVVTAHQHGTNDSGGLPEGKVC